MKKMFVLAGLCTIICSCSSDFNVLNNNTLPISDYSHENMLEFSTKEEFFAEVSKIEALSTQQQDELDTLQYPNFFSMFDLYNMAMCDAEKMDDSRESYVTFKEKYSPYFYFPEYKEDYGVYLPVSNKNIARLLNIHGNVRIGGKILNMNDITNYAQLQRIGVALYDENENIATRASNIGYEYDSGWFHYNNSKKIKLKCGRQATSIDPITIGGAITYRLHFEISFRKKTWLGWTNYSSRVDMEGFYQIINVVNISEHKEADSSHDYYYGPYYTPYVWLQDGTTPFIGAIMPAVHVEVNLHYRGIPDEYMPDYNFTLPEFAVQQL